VQLATLLIEIEETLYLFLCENVMESVSRLIERRTVDPVL
jgi:hypothetical protein